MVEGLQNSVIDPKSNDISAFHRSDCKRMKISTESNQEEEDVKSSGQTSPPLGLTLSKTQSFLNLVEMKLSQASTQSSSTENPNSSPRDGSQAKMGDSEKIKASNFPAILLKIGSWEKLSRYEGDLVVKCYYAKKKIVWEVLEGPLKSKIEIQWSDIGAIRAICCESEPGILEIELNQAPMFFRETNPQPRKHTSWQPASDFTGGLAGRCRRHCVKFPPGTLEKHYEKLLQCDKHLFALSQRPFPRLESPYFDSDVYGVTDINFDFRARQSQFAHGLERSSSERATQPQFPRALVRSFSEIPSSSYFPPHRAQNLKVMTGQAIGVDSPMSVMDFPRRDEVFSSYMIDNQMVAQRGQEGNYVENIYAMGDQIQAAQAGGAAFSCQGYQEHAYGVQAMGPDPNTMVLNDIENHLLGDSQVPCSDESQLMSRVRAMCSLLEPLDELCNIGTNQFGNEQEKFIEDNSNLGTTEHFEVGGGFVYPQQVFGDENHPVMMPHLPGENYPYTYPVPNYEVVGESHEVQKNAGSKGRGSGRL